MNEIICKDLHEVVELLDSLLDEDYSILITFEDGFYTIAFSKG